MPKFRAGQPVWVISEHDEDDPIRYAGTVVRLKAMGRERDTGRVVEFYSVKVPELPDGLWEVPDGYLRPRTVLPQDPPGLTDVTPDKPTSWERCAWQPGDHLKGQGRIYVP